MPKRKPDWWALPATWLSFICQFLLVGIHSFRTPIIKLTKHSQVKKHTTHTESPSLSLSLSSCAFSIWTEKEKPQFPPNFQHPLSKTFHLWIPELKIFQLRPISESNAPWFSSFFGDRVKFWNARTSCSGEQWWILHTLVAFAELWGE